MSLCPPPSCVSLCCCIHPSVSFSVNEPWLKVKITKAEQWNHPPWWSLHSVTVMSWKPTVKLHDEDLRFSCYRYHNTRSQQIKPAWAGIALPFFVSCRSRESCSHRALEVIVPSTTTPLPHQNKCTPSPFSLCLSCLSVSSPEIRDSWLRMIKIVRGR